MYPGHFAAGLALKVYEPKASMLGLMIGVGLLDLLFAICVGLGIEGGVIGHLHIPWSHSLVMAVVWSVGYGVVFWRFRIRVSAVMGLAVFSHWVLDLLSHAPDMAMSPHTTAMFGYGPVFGGLGGWLELLISFAGAGVYIWWARRTRNRERRWPVTALMVAAMYVAEVLVVHPFR